jgi:hypothetical protein
MTSAASALSGDPGWIRTSDLQLRRLLLYPLSYGAAWVFGLDTFGVASRGPRGDYVSRFGTFLRRLYGAGFVNVPGSDACIKIGGSVTIEGGR